MMFFLKIVAAFVVAILLLLILVVFLIRWKFRRFLKRIVDECSAGGTVPPFRVKLIPVDDESIGWNRSEEVTSLTDEFRKLNFTPIGDFDAEDLPLRIRAFQHQEHQAYGVIYEHAAAGCWCDVVRRYTDDTGWTVSSGKEHGMDSAPWHHPLFLPGKPLAELHEKLLELSPSKGLQRAGADVFVQRFESAYAREMNWRIERGGPTEEEIRRIASLNGTEPTPEDVERIQTQWRTAIADFLSELALKVWRKDSGISRQNFDAMSHRLVVIHRKLQPHQLEAILACNDEDDDEDNAETAGSQGEKIRELCRNSSPVAVFHDFISRQDASTGSWSKVGEVHRPLKAEIWERPEQESSQNEEDPESEFDDELNV